MSLFIKTFNGVLRCTSVGDFKNGGELRQNIYEIEGIPPTEIILTCNGRLIVDDDALEQNCIYHAALRLRGGKGGFGSMLRMLGAQIEKTTNHEACRDLSGRRMRDVNNEKKLAEWVKNKADAEAEREQRRREKLERMTRDPKHYFVDPTYDQQKEDVAESLADAVTKGMAASASTSNGASTSGMAASSVKRKVGVNESSSSTKKRCMWMGVEDDSDEDDEDEDTHDGPASNLKSSPSSSVTEQVESTSTSSSKVYDRIDGNIQTDSKKEGTIEPATSSNQLTKMGESSEKTSEVVPSSDDHQSTQDTEQETTPKPMDPVDLEQYSSSSDLEAVGLDRLKVALMERGLKCGGSLKQRAERLFLVTGLSPEQIDLSLKAKPVKGKKKSKK